MALYVYVMTTTAFDKEGELVTTHVDVFANFGSAHDMLHGACSDCASHTLKGDSLAYITHHDGSKETISITRNKVKGG